jgi:hypothetical protein
MDITGVPDHESFVHSCEFACDGLRGMMRGKLSPVEQLYIQDTIVRLRLILASVERRDEAR